MMKKILVPLDGSGLAERAVPYATRFARASGGSVILLHVGSARLARIEPPYDPEVVGRRLRSTGIDVEALTEDPGTATIGSAIAAVARRQHADLIVMATHGRTGPGRWFYGGVAAETLREAEPPIVMIPTSCNRAWPTEHGLRIMVALDGSDLAEKALGPAIELAGVLQATLLLVRVTDSRAHPYTAVHTYAALEAGPEIVEVREYLESIARRLRATGRDIEIHVVQGAPAQTVAAVADEQNVDLIAMRTHGHDDGSHLVLGDVATSTLVRSSLPILFVRSVPIQDRVPEPSPTIYVGLSQSELALVKYALTQLLIPEHDPRVSESARTLLTRLEGTGATLSAR